MPGKLCEQCGHNAAPEAVTCPECGATLAGDGEDPVGQLAESIAESLGAQYRVEERVGEGGAAVVFRVSDLRLNRNLALKALHPAILDRSETALRFRREAETAASLSHPNIVPIFFVGEADGIPYYVMPLIEGQVLGARIRREGGVNFDAAVGIVRDIGAALDFAHAAGVVHRDVKPDNILLEGATGRSLLTDFGIAKASKGETAITGSGMVVGTPFYVSPEQASVGGEVDGRSDVYSLGVVVYEMLTGTVPYVGDSPQAIFAQHLTADVPSVAQRCAGAPAAFESVMRRVLAKNPEERFQTAGSFAHAMEAVRQVRGVRPSGGSLIARQLRSDVSQFRTLDTTEAGNASDVLEAARDPAQAAEAAEAIERQLRAAVAEGRGLDLAVGIGVLLHGLDDRRPAYRQPVERVLHRLARDARVVEVLANAWQAGDEEEQGRAEIAIAGLDGGPAALVALACRERSAPLMLLADRVGGLDPEAVRQIAADRRISVVQAFLRAVRESARPAERIESWLQLVLRHQHPDVRCLVLEVAGERGGPMAERLGRLGLTARESVVREMALRTMGRSGRRVVLPALAQRLENGPRPEQVAAAAGLGSLGYREAVPVLQRVFRRKRLLKHERGPVQVAAAEALGVLPFPEARQALETLAGDHHSGVATAARRALGGRGKVPAG